MVKSNKYTGKIFIVLIIAIVLVVVIILLVFSGIFGKKPKEVTVLDNPMKKIIFDNTYQGKVDFEKVLEQGVKEFDKDYVNYLLISSGAEKLHKSVIGYGDPAIELNIDNEVWSVKIENGNLITEKSSIENEDFKIIISKQEIVKALLSENTYEFFKNSLKSGNIQAELVAGKAELLSKGYLEMYQSLSG